MYGLTEYALLRQQMHDANKRKSVAPEFDYAVTRPIPEKKGRAVRLIGRVLVRRRTLRLYIKVGL